MCFEIHPGEDLHDGASFEMFLARVGNHPRCKILYDPSHFVLQQLDYLGFIDLYHERIGAFHVKDAEFNPTARQGVYGGYQSWVDRAGRFRSLGDGQVNFRGIFSKLAQYGFDGWAVLEWECAIKSAEQGAREGAPFIRDHLIEVTGKGVRRLRRRGHGRCSEPSHARAGLKPCARTIACVSAWSAAARARSSARCTASPRGWMTLIRLVCGALSSDAERARNSGAELGLDPARSYGSYAEMFAAERNARRRHGGGGDRDAEPSALSGCVRRVGSRLPRDLRQTACHQRGRSGGTGAPRQPMPDAFSRSPTITPATRWCARHAR